MKGIRNIYCVGRNFPLHAAELGNAIPERPLIFSKPTHALVLLDGSALHLPGTRGAVHYEAELVLRVDHPYQKGSTADGLIGAMALGIDFTLRDVQAESKRKGQPWLEAKGFPNSAALTPFIPFPGVAALAEADFTLTRNGVEAQRGNVRDMLFNVQQILDFCAASFGIGPGDIIYTGTPAGVGPVTPDDTFHLYWGSRCLGQGVVCLDALE
ncbi:FAA hydrolase family protein [Heliobacterium gestii]|uniref:FAA hydrolase family protein n=1 Tax=Heliomicrobium gestii TaxID=2699 RepID=A0A845LFW3_HELGE|nr:fumarylacetoacetate hydrolase family protein [Heliomicrobium gestii]MBM7867296.1 2-keto-4-pentenoate hydratase/2-oxohepta-3-ene-1,7-dioic acid hydratase in catechol pathway [Heliomicrobium gestii]MZP43850.1 FAA hydrolase family protein [Heliomicrobium gestii]